MDIASQCLYLLHHLVAGGVAGRLVGQAVDNVAHASQRIVLVSRPGVDVNANTGEVPWQGFGRNADTIGERGDLVEFGGVL